MKTRSGILLALVAAAPGATAAAGRLAPLASGAVSAHGPFVSRDCKVCHERTDARNPGAVTRVVNEICFDCHDDFRGALTRRMGHPPPSETCTNCHNPHNSMKRKLLL